MIVNDDYMTRILVVKIGQFEQTSDQNKIAVYHTQFGCVKSQQGDVETTLRCREKALLYFSTLTIFESSSS